MRVEELVVFAIVGYTAFTLIDKKRAMANEGLLETRPEVAAADGAAAQLAPISDIESRDPNVKCEAQPPEMLSTSLLPTNNEPMADADFVGITPEGASYGVNYLGSAWALGRDTQGGNTTKNSNHQLRADIANPRNLTMKTNAFSNTTIGTFTNPKQIVIHEGDDSP